MSTQHHDGGVALVQSSDGSDYGTDAYFTERAMGYGLRRDQFTPTHIAFPVAQAARLIDPTDPQVRERIASALRDCGAQAWITDAILAAIQKGAPE